MNFDFSGQVVLIAGGTGGLGRAVSLAYLNANANVIVTYRREEGFLELKNLVGSMSSRLEGSQVDVGDPSATTEAVADIARRSGRLDVLVNTVGGYIGGKTLWETEPKDLDQMLALNLRSGYALARAVLPWMLKAQHGSIVNVAARAAVDHGAGASAYAASKAAAVALIDSLAADVRGQGIRVNSILPSIIDTPANRRAMPGSNFLTWPKPEEIANVVLFLTSDLAKTIHGAAVPVYGDS